MKLGISSPEDIGAALKDALSDFNVAFEQDIDQSMADVSRQAYEKAKELAAARLHRTKQQYIDALSLERIGPNVYAVKLDASAVHLEEGYPAFSMIPGLLHLNRGFSDLPQDVKGKIKMSKSGYRYRAIPMEPNGAAANPDHPLHNAQMRIGKPDQTTMGAFGAEFNALKKWANAVSKASGDRGVTGKAWTISRDPMNRHTAVATLASGQQFKKNMGRDWSEHLEGLTNIRAQHESNPNKVRSAYMTFRVVSEDPRYAGKWIHPGFAGAHILQDVQRWTEEAFSRMVDELFRKAG